MEEVLIPILVVGILFIGLPWLVFHYVTKCEQAATITGADEKLLDHLHEMARRLDDRLCTIERIMTAENPNWRQQCLPGRESSNRLLPEENRLVTKIVSNNMNLNAEELAVADWVYRHAEPAGRHTQTLPAAQLRYLPLKTSKGVMGVLGVGKPNSRDSDLTSAQRRLMEAFANQGAQAIERTLLEEQNRQIALLQSAEKLQNALLNSISHDFRTPLVAVTGALSALDENYVQMDEVSRNALIDNARGEAERLNRLVGNLLNMTRIESGTIKLHIEPGDIQDLIGTALEQLGHRIGGHEIKVNIPDEFPLVQMDFTLMVQVIVNLLENAVKYSNDDTLIEVNASVADSTVRLTIADRGVGIPTEDLPRVFDKFYRVQRPESISGTGLGLSIGKGIVEAHQGHISAINRAGGGTIILVELPLTQQ